MSKTHICADLHFYHSNIRKYYPVTRGHFQTVEDMNEKIISNWNEDVEPNDLVYILGDVAFARPEQACALLSKMHGDKILITGNHDKKLLKDRFFRHQFQAIHDYLEVRHVYENKTDHVNLVLFHYAISEWSRIHHVAIHFHGHQHGNPRPIGVDGRIKDVGMDCNNLHVFDLDKLSRDMLQYPIRGHHDILTRT